MYYLMRNMQWNDFDYMNTSPLFITEDKNIDYCICLKRDKSESILHGVLNTFEFGLRERVVIVDEAKGTRVWKKFAYPILKQEDRSCIISGTLNYLRAYTPNLRIMTNYELQLTLKKDNNAQCLVNRWVQGYYNYPYGKDLKTVDCDIQVRNGINDFWTAPYVLDYNFKDGNVIREETNDFHS